MNEENQQQQNKNQEQNQNLDQQPSLLKRLHGNKKAQMALFAFTMIYLISPIDLIPDTIPIVGVFDDIGIVIAEIAQFLVYLNNQKIALNKKIKKHKR